MLILGVRDFKKTITIKLYSLYSPLELCESNANTSICANFIFVHCYSMCLFIASTCCILSNCH